MGAPAVNAAVRVAAGERRLLALPTIEPAAALLRLAMAHLLTQVGLCGVVEPAEPWTIRVTWTHLGEVVFLQAVGTPRDGPRVAGKRLIIEAGIGD